MLPRRSLTRGALLFVARSVVNLAHHQGGHERVNVGGAAVVCTAGDGDGCS